MIIPLLLSALLTVAAEGERAVQIVSAPDSPVRLDSTKILNSGSEPLVLLYGASNTTQAPIDQFTVTVFVFRADGQLKARQVAPGRRELPVGQTKYSAMVLDVGAIERDRHADGGSRSGATRRVGRMVAHGPEGAGGERCKDQGALTPRQILRGVGSLDPTGGDTRRYVRSVLRPASNRAE